MNYENNNIVKVRGKLVEELKYSHTIMGEGFFEGKIEIKRLSDESDILPITVSERLSLNVKVGEFVTIVGQLRSYNREEDGHSKLMLTVFARKISDDCEEEYNNINLIGYICKPPVFRTTPFGREIADVLLAVNRSYNKSDYLPCIAWGRNARFIKDMQVGEKIEITGRVQSRQYQKKDENGETIIKTAYEISINSAILAEENYQQNEGIIVENSKKIAARV